MSNFVTQTPNITPKNDKTIAKIHLTDKIQADRFALVSILGNLA
jgi:hypothetical protein